MPRYVTVTPASVRSVAATLTARTVAVSRRYLFSSAARANIVAARTIAAALSRGRTALVPVRAVRTVVADVVARRALAVGVMGDRLVSAGLGAVRTLAALVAAGRSAFAGMVRRRPGAGTVSAARTASAVQYRGRTFSAYFAGRRDVTLAPYTSVRTESGVLVDSNSANVVDSNGANIDTLEIFTTVSYLRWRVMYPVVLGARTIAASPVAKRLLAASSAGVRTVAALPKAVRQLAASIVADPTVPRFTSFLRHRSLLVMPVASKRTVAFAPYTSTLVTVDVVVDSNDANIVDSSGNNLDSEQITVTTTYLRWRVASSTTAGSRTVVAAPHRQARAVASVSGQRQISASLFNSTLLTDSSGANITDDTSSSINVLI